MNDFLNLTDATENAEEIKQRLTLLARIIALEKSMAAERQTMISLKMQLPVTKSWERHDFGQRIPKFSKTEEIHDFSMNHHEHLGTPKLPEYDKMTWWIEH